MRRFLAWCYPLWIRADLGEATGEPGTLWVRARWWGRPRGYVLYRPCQWALYVTADADRDTITCNRQAVGWRRPWACDRHR